MRSTLKRYLFIFVALEAALVFSVWFASGPNITVSENHAFTVAIDAGHGGIDGGAVGTTSGVKESDINLAIAKKLRDRFTDLSFNVVMTRSGEGGLYGLPSAGFKRRDLEERVKIVNGSKADVLISVHLNKYGDGSRRGAQVFYRAGDEKSKALAESLQKSFNAMKEAVKKTTPLVGDYFLLNETAIPAVICECGFLSNAEDEALLLSEDYQLALCEAISIGTSEFFAS